jgi:hypothetical protein
MRRCIAYDSYDWNPPMRQNQGTVMSQSSARTHRRRAGIELADRLQATPGSSRAYLAFRSHLLELRRGKRLCSRTAATRQPR